MRPEVLASRARSDSGMGERGRALWRPNTDTVVGQAEKVKHRVLHRLRIAEEPAGVDDVHPVTADRRLIRCSLSE